ncbi:MAG: lysophospholipid acyltransferase family protein [Chloroflexi bacterium]|jgi:phosphatidylinositol dimannoside acyltransferase|nr:lysophospholipid acyltransferase family protein [Chloroflexota bacterium]
MLTYYAFKIAQYTVAYLPNRIGYFFSRLVADLIYLLSPKTGANVSDNMKHVLGSDADDATIKKATRGVIRSVVRNYFGMIKLPRTKYGDIENRAVLHGFHNLEEALARGKGVILATAHLGSFDAAVQILAAKSVKTTILVEPLEPPALLKHVIWLRESMGLSCLPAQLSSLRGMIRRLHRGETILITCDRDFTNDGVKMDFFGAETSIPDGAVRIAMKTGAAVVPAFNLLREDGKYDIFWEPAIDLLPEGDGTVEKNVEQVTRVVEKYIKSAPDQWVVTSPIWANRNNPRQSRE